MGQYCEKCGLVKDEKEFYMSNNREKYPTGHLNICKKCTTMMVDNWDPETYKWILEEVDVPYIEDEWNALLIKYAEDPKKLTGMTIIGKYLAKMKLKQWKAYRWVDSERLNKEKQEAKVNSMREQGFSGDEIEEQLSKSNLPPKPTTLSDATALPAADSTAIDEIQSEFESQLSDEEKTTLLLKWGRGYRVDEWVHMEQLYQDMMNSYDIQGAGQKDTLLMICKASLRANQLIDAGDIEGFQKAQKAYNDLMKSANLTAAQIKETEKEGIDSVGELVAICERDGFIPRYYVDKPKDKVDRVLQDMQKYTHDLVVEELGLGNLIENSVKQIEREREQIHAASAGDIEKKEEEELFSYNANEIEDQDFIDFNNAMEVKPNES